MDIVMNDAMYHRHENGPFQMVATVNHETWTVEGDTVEELLANARSLRDEYALNEDDIMRMESDAELEVAYQNEKTAREIYRYVCEWA